MFSPAQDTGLPPDPATTDVVPRKPAEPFTPGPLIADILRTRFCVPGSVFLVEGVDENIAVGKRHRTVRLLLGDGQLCIQALLVPELHGIVESGQVYVGCYVRSNAFDVRWSDLDVGFEDREEGLTAAEAAARQQNAPREMVYLVLEDLLVVGWNTVYADMGNTQHARPGQEGSFSNSGNSGRHVHFKEPSKAKEATGPDDGLDVPDDDDEFETMDRSEEKSTQRRISSSGPFSSRQEYIRPWTSTDLTKPLKLTPLRSIPNLPYKQNWMVNVLAVVASLSAIEPSLLPPHTQRTARIADLSTSKEVLLTVFLDAEQFCPRVGSVVLLMGVKNHRFDGGSLKKYPSDRPVDGKSWWIEDPWNLEWCDVAGLTAWWEGREK